MESVTSDAGIQRATDRRKQLGVREFIEVTQMAILQAAADLGTLTNQGATPQNLVDQVRASLVVRECDFARAIGILVADDLLDVSVDNNHWCYALTALGKSRLSGWIEGLGVESSDWSTTHARTRMQAIHALLARRAQHALAAETATRH